MKKTMLRLAVPACFLTAICCGPITKLTDTFTNPTAREIYERGFRDKEILSEWNSAHELAVADGVSVSLPYGEKGAFHRQSNAAYGYSVNLTAGEVLTASVVKDSLDQQVFMEIYRWDGKSFKTTTESKPNSSSIEFPVTETGVYKLVLQPEMAADTDFFLSINKKPMYRFPVAEKGNSAIGSFWADMRDGGKRSHEGIDIFAKRGTPVVAATDGTIGFTGERGIGGKQVWLRTGNFGKSVYYAHLDRIAVSQGQSVKTGDTLGFVGNTGNAKTTVPHLHFGIYGNSGAVDPLPFVYQTTNVKPERYPNLNGKSAVVSGNVNLRIGPTTNHAVKTRLQPNERLTLLGRHKDWLHVKTSSGFAGFVHRKLVKVG